MGKQLRSNSTKESAAPGLISQCAFAREHNWSPQYVSKLVQQGKVTLVDGKVDAQAANQQLKANAVGMLRVNGARNRQDAAVSGEKRLKFAIHHILVAAATAWRYLDLGDPDQAEGVLRSVGADLPEILDGTFDIDD